MKSARMLIVALCVAAAVAAVPGRAGQTVTSEKNRKKIAEAASLLETAPLSKKAKKERQRALSMLRAAPDLRVEPCRALLGELLLSRELGAQDLRVQLPISSAKFMIENPDLASDRDAVLFAGVEGVLRSYEAMRRTNPLVSIDYLDEVIARRERGELADVVREALADCSR